MIRNLAANPFTRDLPHVNISLPVLYVIALIITVLVAIRLGETLGSYLFATAGAFVLGMMAERVFPHLSTIIISERWLYLIAIALVAFMAIKAGGAAWHFTVAGLVFGDLLNQVFANVGRWTVSLSSAWAYAVVIAACLGGIILSIRSRRSEALGRKS
jgi:hypothetical protein